MIYRIYSNLNEPDFRVLGATASWENKNIINIGINDSELQRNLYDLPYLKDLLDLSVLKCENDDDMIIYTNSDIGLVSDFLDFPNENFFSVRKEVDIVKNYTTEELEDVPFTHSINCDVFGFTKKWYLDNRDNIPDFIIGSPYWDLAFICILNGKRLDNINYHVKHEANWKTIQNKPKGEYNRGLFLDYFRKNNIPTFNDIVDGETFFDYMSKRYGFDYINNPKFISFFTPSHKSLFELQLKTFNKVYKENRCSFHYKTEDQFCKTAIYHSKGWKETQIQKVNFILNEIVKMKDDQIFIFCDADIIHTNNCLEEIKSYLKKFDLIAQSTKSELKHHDLCSGFFAGKKNKKNVEFFKKILSELQRTYREESAADQYYFNENSNMVRCFGLDAEYFNPIFNKKTLKPIEENEFNEIIDVIPDNVKIIHATWMLGVKQKINFLKKCVDRFLNPDKI